MRKSLKERCPTKLKDFIVVCESEVADEKLIYHIQGMRKCLMIDECTTKLQKFGIYDWKHVLIKQHCFKSKDLS